MASTQELMRALSQLSPKARLDALTESDEAEALVRSYPAERLYYDLLEVGLADSADLVQLASPEQFRTFIDLGGWQKDRIDPHRVLTWIRAARGEDRDQFLGRLRGMDLEVLEVVLRAFTTVHDLEENPDVNPEGVTVETPEGRYLVEVNAEGVEQAAIRALVNDLIAQNPFEGVRLLEALRWELPSELEETAYRFRTARLADLGFPPLEEAVSLFAYLDPDKVLGERPELAARPTTALAPSGTRVDFLAAALRELDAGEREALEDELRQVANAALVADAADPGDLAAVRRIGEWVHETLGLALEHLTGANPARAAAVVRDLPSRKLFQVGFSLTLKLKFEADRLHRQPLSHLGDAWLVTDELAKTLSALRRKRPMRALHVEGAEPVPFRSRKELDQAREELARASAQLQLFRALLGGAQPEAQARLARITPSFEALGPEGLLRGAIARAALDEDPRLLPLPAERVHLALHALFDGGRAVAHVRPELAAKIRDALGALVDDTARREIGRLVDAALAALPTEVGSAWASEGTLEPTTVALFPTERL